MLNRIIRGSVRGRFGSGAPRRKTDWLFSQDTTGVKGLLQGVAVLDQFFEPFESVTVVRTRGMLYVQSDQQAADEEAFGAMGMAVVSTQAKDVGVTAVPTPISDEGSDLFFVYEAFAFGYTFFSSVGATSKGTQFRFDSKAQRKVEPEQSIVVTVENADATFGLQYILKFRMLIKLS